MRRIIYPLFMATALLSAGCIHGLEQGTRALQAKDFDRAESIARSELISDASSPWANLLMAETLVARGEYRRALSFAKRADEQGLFPGRAPKLVGDISKELGRLVEAAQYYWRAREDDPSLIDDDLLRQILLSGIETSAAERDHHALWELRSLLAKLDPQHEEASPKRLAAARRAYAVALRDSGEYRAAAELLRQALDDDPTYLTGEAFDLAEVYARLEMYEDAAEAWQTYVSADVDKEELIQRHFDVAEAAAKHKLFSVAISSLEAVLPDTDSTLRGPRQLDLAYYQLSAERDDDARQTLANFIDDGVTGFPDQAHPVDVYSRAAELALRENRTRMGIQILEQGTTHALPSQTLTRQLADIYARRAQLDAVEEVLNRFITKSDDKADALLFAASWTQERRNHELTRHFLSQAAELPDASPAVFLELAQVHGALENYDELTQAVMTYLNKAGRTEQTLSQAASLLTNHRAYEQAEPLFIELRRLQPQLLTSAAALATLYRLWNRPQDSIKVWESWIKARGSRPSDMEQVAQTLLNEGELDQAARFFRRAGEAGSYVAWLRAADIYLQQDDQGALIAALDAYLNDHSDRALALERIASRYQRAKMKSRQLQAVRELTELRPHHWPYIDALVTLLLEQDHEEEALKLLAGFVSGAPDADAALAQIGERFARGPNARFLVELYSQLLDDDAHPTIWRLMGDAYYGLSRHEGLSDEAKKSLLRHAHQSYLRFIETADEDQNWRRLSREWIQREMWRSAALANERLMTGSSGYDQRDYLDIAEVYLRTGQPQQAEEFLASSGFTAPDGVLWVRIARLLYRFQRYDAAEQYARQVLGSSADMYTTIDAFTVLSAIYREREDFEALDKLIAQFPEETSNRRQARYQTHHTLIENGRWQQAVDLGDKLRIRDFESLTQGSLYLYQGDPKSAFDAFEEAANEAHDPAPVWLNAARNFELRGHIELARQSLEQARRIAPDEPRVLVQHAQFLANRGELEHSLEEFKAALKSEPQLTDSSSEPYLKALINAGRFDLLRQAIDASAKASAALPESIMLDKYSWDLRNQDQAALSRAIAGLHAHSWGVSNVTLHLRQAGHYQELLRLVNEEFKEGSASTASILLLSNASELARVTDWSAQRSDLEAIVDPLRRSDTRLIGVVGDLRSRTGDLSGARTYLQAAVDYSDHGYLAQLGHALLNLGERDEAMEYFKAWLFQNPTEDGLESILLRFELAGEPEAASQFLAQIVHEPPLLHIALPQKLHYDLERHADPHRAIQTLFAHLEQAHKLPSRHFRASQSQQAPTYQPREEILSLSLSRSLEAIAALGYLDTLESALERVERADYDQDALVPLRLKLAIAKGDLESADEMVRQHLLSTDGNLERQELRLDLARQLLAIGADSSARRLVDEALKEQVDFRNHQPMALHLGLLLLEGRGDALLDEARIYLDRVPNRLAARRTLIDELRRLGRDDEALTLAQEMAELIPTEDHIKTALTIALDAGNSKEVQRLTPLYINTAGIDALGELITPRLTGSEPDLLLPLIRRIRSAQPADLQWQIHEMRLLLSKGDVQQARALMLDAAQTRSFDREAVTLIIELLAQEQFDVELARTLAPALPDSALWPRTMIRIAEAELAMGFTEQAKTWLEKVDKSALEPKLWRLELGDRLARRHLFHHIPLALADIDEEHSPQARYLRALVDLASGDAQTGLKKLQQANYDGVRILQTHYYGIPAALQANDSKTAQTLMSELITIPLHDAAVVSFPFQLALRAAMNRPGGPEAILQFLENERPRLVDGQGATWTQFAGQLAGVFERTGDPQGSYGFYRDRIWQAQFRGREDRSLPIYLNNLAYTYSTTDHEIDAGLKNIYRALILAQRRNSSYIDTLGWLLHRRGEPAKAEAEIRRSLRAYEGPPSGLHELTLHLKELLEQRGAFGEAAWLEVQLNRLPLDDMEW